MTYTEAYHLDGKNPVVLKMYSCLVSELKKFGEIKIEPKKTSIHLCSRYAFAGVYTRNNYINLEFHLDYKLNSNRISKAEQHSANRYHHSTKLSSEKDVDKELLSWLKQAYDLKS